MSDPNAQLIVFDIHGKWREIWQNDEVVTPFVEAEGALSVLNEAGNRRGYYVAGSWGRFNYNIGIVEVGK